MANLLVRHDTLRAERTAIVRVVAWLDPDDLPIGDAQVHSALDAAERAVRWDQPLGDAVGLGPLCPAVPDLLEVLVDVAPLDEGAAIDAHVSSRWSGLNGPLRWPCYTNRSPINW